jgi:hypothetical protein
MQRVRARLETQRKVTQERRNAESEVKRLAMLEAQRKIDRERRNADSEIDRLARLEAQRRKAQ